MMEIPLMDEVLSEERQLTKWVGILQLGISRESWMGGNFQGGFSVGEFSENQS